MRTIGKSPTVNHDSDLQRKNEGKELHIVLPLAPTINHAYFTTRFGGRALKKHGREWMQAAQSILNHEVKRQGWELVKDEKIKVDILTVFPDRRRRDSHNTLKLLLDAPHGYVYEDDKVVLPRCVDYKVDKNNPRSELVFSMFDEEKDGWKYDEMKEGK